KTELRSIIEDEKSQFLSNNYNYQFYVDRLKETKQKYIDQLPKNIHQYNYGSYNYLPDQNTAKLKQVYKYMYIFQKVHKIILIKQIFHNQNTIHLFQMQCVRFPRKKNYKVSNLNGQIQV
ncbi:hypothetical protein IMG5_049240, partial [Ichthyophthirius multifiliis]